MEKAVSTHRGQDHPGQSEPEIGDPPAHQDASSPCPTWEARTGDQSSSAGGLERPEVVEHEQGLPQREHPGGTEEGSTTGLSNPGPPGGARLMSSGVEVR